MYDISMGDEASYRGRVIGWCLAEFKCKDEEADNISKIVMKEFFKVANEAFPVDPVGLLRRLTCREYMNHKGKELRAILFLQFTRKKGWNLSDEKANDVVQDALERFIKYVGNGGPIKATPLALLRTMARNAVLNLHAKERREDRKEYAVLTGVKSNRTEEIEPVELRRMLDNNEVNDVPKEKHISKANVDDDFMIKITNDMIETILGLEKYDNPKTYAVVKMYFFGIDSDVFDELRQILNLDHAAEKLLKTFIYGVGENGNREMTYKNIGEILGIAQQAVHKRLEAFMARARIPLQPLVEG